MKRTTSLPTSCTTSAKVTNEPDRFDIGRSNARTHTSFGYGIHFCLGAPLARLQAKVVLEELTQALPQLALVPGQPFNFVPNTSFRAPVALLYRMAANLMVDHVRSAQRSSRRNGQWRMETHTAIGGEDVASDMPADEAVLARERVRLLADAVAALPPKMGQAFRLHKLEGLSQADTARAMGVSVKMIEQHIQAAIANLSQRLRS